MITFLAIFGGLWLLALVPTVLVFGPRAYQMLRRDAAFRAYLMLQFPWLRRLWIWLHKSKSTIGGLILIVTTLGLLLIALIITAPTA